MDDQSDRDRVIAYLREIAKRWRNREPFTNAELIADEFDEAASAIEAGEHLHEIDT